MLRKINRALLACLMLKLFSHCRNLSRSAAVSMFEGGNVLISKYETDAGLTRDKVETLLSSSKFSIAYREQYGRSVEIGSILAAPGHYPQLILWQSLSQHSGQPRIAQIDSLKKFPDPRQQSG